MADTDNFSFPLMATGSNVGTWGTILNNGIFTPLDAILGGTFPVTITVANVTLTPMQFQSAIFLITGALTGNRNLIVPLSPNSATVACGGKFIVVNTTTGNFNLTVLTEASGSEGVIIPQGMACALYSDGTNVEYDNSGLPALIPAYAGSPNGFVAGTAGSVNTLQSILYDYTNGGLYFCTTTGTTSTAVWTAIAPAPGSITQASLAPGAAPMAYVGPQPSPNLTMSNGTSATRDVSVTKGRVRDDSDTTNLQLAATMGKRLDTSWAAGGTAGSPAGGCDSGTKGNNQTWNGYLIGKLSQVITQYARTTNVATITVATHGLGVGGTVRVIGIAPGFDGVFAITAVATNTISYASSGVNVSTTTAPSRAIADGFDLVFSQSYNSPTLPAGWTVQQCVGSVITDASANIRPFTQIADYFDWTTPTVDFGPTSISTASTSLTVAVPNGVAVEAWFNLIHTDSGSGALVYFRRPGDTDAAPSSASAPLANVGQNAANETGKAYQMRIYTNTTQQIAARASAAGQSVTGATTGYRDPRRQTF